MICHSSSALLRKTPIAILAGLLALFAIVAPSIAQQPGENSGDAPAPPPPPPPIPSARDENGTAKIDYRAIVRVENASRVVDYKKPWNTGGFSGGSGTGWFIGKNRFITNAHVVSNSTRLNIKKFGDPTPYKAKILHIAHDCDLAMLEVEDPAPFKDIVPLEIGPLPKLEETVRVIGYPIGGKRVSVTRGVVSRIDFNSYSHSAADQHLTVQIDAAINPGNSGGPVFHQDGTIAGVAFQGYSGAVAQNVGYMIPTPVVKRFLKDIEDGSYDHYVDLSVAEFNVVNPAQRRALGLENDGLGIMVSAVRSGGSSENQLHVGDVILEIDGKPVASNGFIEVDGERVNMNEIVERKFKGEKVRLKIRRDKKDSDVEVTLKRFEPALMVANNYDVLPRFIMFAGLVFQPLDRNLMGAHSISNLQVRYQFLNYSLKEIFKTKKDVVILTTILPDEVNSELRGFEQSVVESINGVEINSMEDAHKALLEAPADVKFFVIKCAGEGRPLVLEAARARAAQQRIMQKYNVTSASYLGETEPEDAGADPEPGKSAAAPGVEGQDGAKGKEGAEGAKGKPSASKSVVRVNVTSQKYNFFTPWQKGNPSGRRGLGAVIADGKVLTTAQLVSNHTYIELEMADSGRKTPAKIVALDYEANLALLKPADDNSPFLNSMVPLELDLSAVKGDKLTVWQIEDNGTPITTEGEITKAEVTSYFLDNGFFLTYEMKIAMQQKDGSFTVPVVKGDKLAGFLVTYSSNQQVATILAAPIIDHFLNDVGDGKYEGFPNLGIKYSELIDEQLRAYVGVKDDQGGVFISAVIADGSAEKAGLKVGDVLLEVNGHAIDVRGNYNDPKYGKVNFANLTGGFAKVGEEIPMKIIRDGKEQELKMRMLRKEPGEYLIDPYMFDRGPRFYILGGIIFQELTGEHLKAWGNDWRTRAPFPFVFAESNQKKLEEEGRRKLVFLSNIIQTENNKGYESLRFLIVTKVNNKEIGDIKDLAEAFKSPIDGIHKIEFEDQPKIIYVDAEEAEATNQNIILRRYRIPELKRLD